MLPSWRSAPALLAFILFSVAVSAQTQSQPDAVAACADIPPGKVTYAEVSISRIESAIPQLKGLKPSPDPAACAALLSHTGPMLADMLNHMPNLIAQEDVWQLRVQLPYFDGAMNTATPSAFSMPNARISMNGLELEAKLREIVRIQGEKAHYSYRIHPAEIARTPVEGLLSEFRTNDHDEPVTGPNWQGFAALWMIFLPEHWQESHFRYLGTQNLHGRSTAVLAFAQVPDRVAIPGSIANSSGSTDQFFLQGILWVDQATFDLVRIQTDLLRAHIDHVAYYRKLRSSVDFQKVTIPERNLSLWLPSNVEVLWEMTSSAGIEAHTYAKYRLFAATSRIVSLQ